MTECKNLLDILTEGRQLPDSYDSWAIKSVQSDLRTRNDFRWPFSDNETNRFELLDHDGSCPKQVGDGLCVAKTWAGMASGGYPARTLLLVAYREKEARGNEPGKMRVPQAFVVDLIDGEALVGKHGSEANLGGANLRGADLTEANLRGAYLTEANLRGADLTEANLRGAYLTRANLTRANLRGADLTEANLRGAYLTGAYLTGANLRGADLYGANLRRAYLTGADLRGAYLTGADLRGALGLPAELKGDRKK